MYLFTFQASWDAIAFIILFVLICNTLWKILWLPCGDTTNIVIYTAILLELFVFMVGLMGIKEFLIAQLLVALFWLAMSLSDSLPKV